jgi:hypothetical protein
MAKRQDSKVRRDSMDFRDLIYQPALVPISKEKYPNWDRVKVGDQKAEGACTGFGLAAVVNYLNLERGDNTEVSPRMLFEMAKRFDQWPGEDYDYSSARGAMKGWYKSGVCPWSEWEYEAGKPGTLTEKAKRAALNYPLGAYYRVLPRVADLHAALNEVSVVYAAAATHAGWDKVDKDGVIPWNDTVLPENGHVFAIIGYDERGFIIQNSWGEAWGGLKLGAQKHGGIALWTYEDFEQNVWDLWVARLALPQTYRLRGTSRYTASPGGARVTESGPPSHTIDHHYVHIDDGQLDPMGDYPSTTEQVTALLDALEKENPEHLLLYAHGGLNPVKDSAMRAHKWRDCFRRNRIFEVHFIWETGFFEQIKDILLGKDKFLRQRVGAASGWWDNLVESSTQWAGHALWKETKADAERAFGGTQAAGAWFLKQLGDRLAKMPGKPKLHLVGHSAGSIWHAHLLTQWHSLGLPNLASLTLFAPACTHRLFTDVYEPALGTVVPRMDLFILGDNDERDDDVASIYRKSLLYLVSRAYESKKQIAPLLGMEIYLERLSANARQKSNVYVSDKHPTMTNSSTHGGFDNDLTTMNAMLQVVFGRKPAAGMAFREEEMKGY